MKRVIALILSVLMLMPMLFGCSGKISDPESSNSADSGKTDSEETAPTQEPADVVIAADGTSAYQVIRPEKTSDTVVNAAVRLRKAILADTGVDMKISEDWYNTRTETLPERATEIIVGATNRTESTEAIAGIREKDFIIELKNDRVVITGGNDTAVAEAVDYFIANFINKENKSIVLKEGFRFVKEHDYILGKLSVNGAALTEYKIVYPAKCDLLTQNAALNLHDYLLSNAGIEVPVVTDKEAETEYELLVGNTNRPATAEAAATVRNSDEFVLCAVGRKVVMLGDNYMAAAAAGTFATEYLKSTGIKTDVDVTNLPTTPSAAKFEFKEAKNAILMIGDGMGRNQVQSTLDSGKLDVFVGDLLPVQNYIITKSYSVISGSASYTDSAAAGTALATGYKTKNGYIGIDRQKKEVPNLRELAYSIGARSSVLTNDKITGATPAVFLAHQGSRDDTAEIQKQIDNVISKGEVDYCAGSVSDRLYDCTRESLQLISADGSRFFTMIEEAYTDKGGHNNEMNTVQKAVIRLNSCIAYAAAFVFFHPDTVLIITADHETGGITKNSDGTYKFTTTTHTNSDVPVYAIGTGTAELFAEKTDNTNIAKFIAKILGNDKFGDLNYKG
ncbi:MAG: alkaline phosphatase [Clostridia bacterium]|nr:alkaline phosphatase [Clostridia bacterium]